MIGNLNLAIALDTKDARTTLPDRYSFYAKPLLSFLL